MVVDHLSLVDRLENKIKTGLCKAIWMEMIIIIQSDSIAVIVLQLQVFKKTLNKNWFITNYHSRAETHSRIN